MRVIAFLTDPPVVRDIPRHLGIPDRPPSFTPARAPPQAEIAFDQSPAVHPSLTSRRTDPTRRPLRHPLFPQHPSSHPYGSQAIGQGCHPSPKSSWPIPESPFYLPLSREEDGSPSYLHPTGCRSPLAGSGPVMLILPGNPDVSCHREAVQMSYQRLLDSPIAGGHAVIDPLGALAESEGTERLFAPGGHYSAQRNSVVAEVIGERLALPPRP